MYVYSCFYFLGHTGFNFKNAYMHIFLKNDHLTECHKTGHTSTYDQYFSSSSYAMHYTDCKVAIYQAQDLM